jgi:hypothetical protein
VCVVGGIKKSTTSKATAARQKTIGYPCSRRVLEFD